MKKLILILLVALLGSGSILAQQVALPATSIALTSREGQDLLLHSTSRVAYWPLSVHHETEVGLSHCGPASAVMVLNALGIAAPTTLTHPPFHMFEQDNFFTSATDAILPEAKLKRQGATLEELAAMVTCHGTRVEVYHAADVSAEEFRRHARHAVETPGEFIIINFLRAPLDQQGGGHFSPIAAFHIDSDRLLVMDVARYKYPPFWTTVSDLHRSMNTVDRTAGKTRGYMVIRGLR